MKRMACVLALATGSGLALGNAAQSAHAEPIPAAASGLQIAVATPKAASGETTMLDVTFKGGNVQSIELYLDGYLIKKQAIRTQGGRGVISFALDGVSEGAHDVLIKATDRDGNTATTSTKLRIGGQEEKESLARFSALKKDEMVQGVVPVQIEVDKSIAKPYVTFLVDKEWLAFINLAPFTYNWDSAKVSNGAHTLEVEIYDGETFALVKRLSLRVNVNNVGGFTHIEKDTPDLNGKAAKTGLGSAIAGIARGVAEAALPTVRIEPQADTSVLSRLGWDFLKTAEMRTGNAPSMIAPTTARNAAPSSFASPDHRPLSPIPGSRPGLRAYTPGGLGTLANPADLAALPELSPISTRLSRQPMRLLRAGNIAARPSLTLNPAAQVAPVAIATAVAAPAAPAAPKVAAAAVTTTTRRAYKGAFAVTFDNKDVDFDVPTRVENGIPLAPFRQIFEHTGGEVQWYDRTQTVRAVNQNTEIQFTIGKKRAKVNNKMVKMDVKPVLDRGRAIVPLSFVRDAMNVSVSYDAKTGRLMIARAL